MRNLLAKSGGVEGSLLVSAMEGLADAATEEVRAEGEFYILTKVSNLSTISIVSYIRLLICINI